MYQINKFFVHFWLAISIATLIYAFYEVYTLGWEKGSPNFFIPVIAFFWWLFRRAVTKRMERKMREGNNR
jgi:hypothetical protein